MITQEGSVMATSSTWSPPRLDSTPFRAFGRADFKPWPAWRRLEKALGSHGGRVGLCGPRGPGKSWLMRHGVDEVRARDGIAVWYPSPSEYDSHAFLASLSTSLAKEI